MRRKRDQHDKWLPLATYNAEVARGIVHTPEWKEQMAKWQAMFDAEMSEVYAGKPRYVYTKPNDMQSSS